jgi:hypothetical protein
MLSDLRFIHLVLLSSWTINSWQDDGVRRKSKSYYFRFFESFEFLYFVSTQIKRISKYYILLERVVKQILFVYFWLRRVPQEDSNDMWGYGRYNIEIAFIFIFIIFQKLLPLMKLWTRWINVNWRRMILTVAKIYPYQTREIPLKIHMFRKLTVSCSQSCLLHQFQLLQQQKGKWSRNETLSMK